MGHLKDIPGYEDRYAVTRDGQIWSYPKARGKGNHFLKPRENADGYLCVNLTPVQGGTYKTHRVHQLVAWTYLEAPTSPSLELHHRNHDQQDNRDENLVWVTHQENVQEIWRAGRRTMQGAKNTRVFLTETTVREIRSLRQSTGQSYSQLAKKFSIRKGHVADICTGRLWSHLSQGASI